MEKGVVFLYVSFSLVNEGMRRKEEGKGTKESYKVTERRRMSVKRVVEMGDL